MINIPLIDEQLVDYLNKHYRKKQLAQMIVDLNNEIMKLNSDLETLRYLNLKLYASQGTEIPKQTP